MNTSNLPPRRVVFAAIVAVLAVACVCPVALPGSGATPTAPPEAVTAGPGGAATAPASSATQAPGGEVAVTAEIPPTDIPRTVIPPTGEVGEALHSVIDGDITSAGQQTTTTFTAAPGQEFFFGVVQIDDPLALTPWSVVDEGGTEIFKGCLGCGNPGVYMLTRGGTYTVLVGGEGEAVGHYQIVIASIRIHFFTITLPATIAEGQPGVGAGSLETPGARDMYTFTAGAGEEIYVGVPEANAVPLSDITLVDEDAVEVFRGCLGCGNPGVFTLERGGTYTLIIGGDAELATGTYEVVIGPVRTDTFAITPGETIGDGFPGPGAGNIETHGARDIYTFNASPGQTMAFEATAAPELALVKWALTDEGGTEVFGTCLGCGTPGTVTLERGGMYTLTVGGDADLGTGTYQVNITPG